MPDINTDAAAKQVWIEPSWLFWKQSVEGRIVSSTTDAVDRPYEIHQHVCDRLAGDPSDLDRVDAITTLRRAVAHRVRRLMDMYELRKLPNPRKIKGELQLLASFDIIRPFMLKRLIDIRNIVEHQDSRPPSTEDCLMFADLIWYFLRSTDSLVHGLLADLLFYPPGTGPYLSELHPSVEARFSESFSAPPEVRAFLTAPSFTYEVTANWIKVESDAIDTYEHDEPWSLITGRMFGN